MLPLWLQSRQQVKSGVSGRLQNHVTVDVREPEGVHTYSHGAPVINGVPSDGSVQPQPRYHRGKPVSWAGLRLKTEMNITE